MIFWSIILLLISFIKLGFVITASSKTFLEYAYDIVDGKMTQLRIVLSFILIDALLEAFLSGYMFITC
jgi:hypothetical protein